MSSARGARLEALTSTSAEQSLSPDCRVQNAHLLLNCVGFYQQDLVYAHEGHSTGVYNAAKRDEQVNAIISRIIEFQTSSYSGYSKKSAANC